MQSTLRGTIPILLPVWFTKCSALRVNLQDELPCVCNTVRGSLNHLVQSGAVPAERVVPAVLQRGTLQVSNLYRFAPDMRTEDGQLLERLGDTFIITGDIYCNSHTNTAARSAAGCAIQVRRGCSSPHLTCMQAMLYASLLTSAAAGASQV